MRRMELGCGRMRKRSMGVLKKDGRETGARSDQKISLSPLALNPTQISLLQLRKKPGIASG